MAESETERALAVYDEAFDVVSRAVPTMLDIEAYLVRLSGRLSVGPTYACWRQAKCRCPSADECECSDGYEVDVIVESAGPGSNCSYVLDLRLASPLGRWPRGSVLRLFSVSADEEERPILDVGQRHCTSHVSPITRFRTLDVNLNERLLVVRFDYMSFRHK